MEAHLAPEMHELPMFAAEKATYRAKLHQFAQVYRTVKTAT